MDGDVAESHNGQSNATQPCPIPMEVHFENLPSEMKLQSRWMLWGYEERNGKYSKVPYQINGKKASSASSLTWTTFDNVKKAFLAGGYDGIGFALGNTYVGIDMDDCFEAGTLSPQASVVLTHIDSYSERSPSGKGIHVICRGEFPETRPLFHRYRSIDGGVP
jgi:putative DNA primase/helicase